MKKALSKYIKLPDRKTLLCYGCAAGVLLVVFCIAYAVFGKSLTAFVSDTDSFKRWLDTYRGYSAAVFVFIRAFQTVIKIIPAEPLEIAAGYAFGTFGGMALCSLGSLLGSLVIVALSRLLGERFIATFVREPQLLQLQALCRQKNVRTFLFIFYLIPGTPKDLLTYAAGALKMNLWEFFLITTIARIPSIITSTLCGAQLGQRQYAPAAAIFILTGLASVLSAVLYKKYKPTPAL